MTSGSLLGGSRYYDLVNNPERYTGYSGAPAANVWKLIYEQELVRCQLLLIDD
jgi:hypothetical protein